MIDEKNLIEWAELVRKDYIKCFGDYDSANVVQYIIDGIKEQPKVGEWIPCSERLPRRNVNVLVYRPRMAMPMLVDRYEGYYGEDDDEWYEGWVYSRNCTVIAWMPLPEPYKEQNNG